MSNANETNLQIISRAIAVEMDRLGYGYHDTNAKSIALTVLATQGTIANDPSVLNADERLLFEQCYEKILPNGREHPWFMRKSYNDDYSYSDMQTLWEGWKHRAALASQLSAQPIDTPVAVASKMPGTDGFTMACFNAKEIPIGTKLYAAPQVAQPSAESMPRSAFKKAVRSVVFGEKFADTEATPPTVDQDGVKP